MATTSMCQKLPVIGLNRNAHKKQLSFIGFFEGSKLEKSVSFQVWVLHYIGVCCMLMSMNFIMFLVFNLSKQSGEVF